MGNADRFGLQSRIEFKNEPAIDRRHFLRVAGAALALPMLKSLPTSASAAVSMDHFSGAGRRLRRPRISLPSIVSIAMTRKAEIRLDTAARLEWENHTTTVFWERVVKALEKGNSISSRTSFSFRVARARSC